MTAIAYGLTQAMAREAELAVIAAFCLACVVLSLSSAHVGLDLGIQNLI
jgi:hypothetical protein